jgi:hypothetical protein
MGNQTDIRNMVGTLDGLAVFIVHVLVGGVRPTLEGAAQPL